MKNVLIVDDAAFMRLSLKTMLTKNGYNVIGEAENGEIGVKRYKELSPDIVTMDITMPQMSGIDALKEIKKFNSNAGSYYDFSNGPGKYGKGCCNFWS
jgi:two-component system chemotaxis response regulator CheY